MTDWSKLKVPELKAELKKRGLAQTGVKAALVARLEEAENEEGAESEATIQDDIGKGDTASAASPDTASPVLPSEGGTETLPDVPLESQTIDTTQEETASQMPTQASQAEKNGTQPAETIESSQMQPQDQPAPSLPVLDSQEAVEDRQKRKRRSQSPPPSTEEASRKRIRPSDAGNAEVVTTKQDSDWVEKHNAVNAADVNAEAEEVAEDGAGAEPGPTIVDVAKEEVTVEQASSGYDGAMDVDEAPKHRDSRQFKNLVTGIESPEQHIAKSNFDDVDVEDEPDRPISPAMHPATAALYIRDIMRPLNPAQLKSHITDSATPPGQDPDPGVLLDFYIDNIRTHAFVSFASVSAASRVRSALHDRVWPEYEKSRKPLWVDFVPVDKIQEWIDIEQREAGSGGRSLAKKWEVIYDEDDARRVTTSLQEIGSISRSSQRQSSQSVVAPYDEPLQTTMDVDHDFAPPSGPRSHQPLQIDQAFLDHDRNKLMQRFKPTKAEPILFWQPVSKDLADSRLDHLEDAYSKDAKSGVRLMGEVNRYTFEDGDMLVDRGIELVPGLRPPRGYRAPRPGAPRTGFGERPGGYRGGRGGFGGGRDDGYNVRLSEARGDSFAGYGGGRSTFDNDRRRGEPSIGYGRGRGYSSGGYGGRYGVESSHGYNADRNGSSTMSSDRRRPPYDNYRDDQRGSRDYGRY